MSKVFSSKWILLFLARRTAYRIYSFWEGRGTEIPIIIPLLKEYIFYYLVEISQSVIRKLTKGWDSSDQLYTIG